MVPGISEFSSRRLKALAKTARIVEGSRNHNADNINDILWNSHVGTVSSAELENSRLDWQMAFDRDGCLVIGSLTFSPVQLQRLRELTNTVTVFSVPPFQVQRVDILRARYIIASNVRLGRYLEELSGVDLLVLAQTGITAIDPESAIAAGVRFVNLERYSTDAVVEYILHCLISGSRPWGRVFEPWTPGDRQHKLGEGIAGTTVGIVGFGNIGRKVSQVLRWMGASVLAVGRRPFDSELATNTELNELLVASDSVVVCCSLNSTSRRLLSHDRLERLKENATVVNIASEEVFDLEGLYMFLRARRDINAWLDHDPSTDSLKLASLPNVHFSPHLAFFTKITLENRINQSIDRIEEHVRSELRK